MKRLPNPFQRACFGAVSPTGNGNDDNATRSIQAVVLARYPEGLAGLTPAELAELAGGDPAGWAAAQGRAARAAAGGRS